MSRTIIQKYNIGAKKSLGQNFLVDEEKLSDIGNILDICGKNIVEVGPGYGALTEKLLEKSPEALHLVELDIDMVDILKERFFSPSPPAPLPRGEGSFQIFHQDVLEYTPSLQKYSVIANIPYYITSPILRHFLYELPNTPDNMLILMQKNVGDKILGKGKNKSSVLSLMIAKKCFASEKLLVSKECFSPQPRVESSVLLFQRHDLYGEVSDEDFLACIKAGFAQPRKKLIKNLVAGGFDMSKIKEFLCLQGKDDNFRGEGGGIGFWIELVKSLK